MRKFLIIILLLILGAPAPLSAAWWNLKIWRKPAPAPQPSLNETLVNKALETGSTTSTSSVQTSSPQASATSSKVEVGKSELEKKIETLLKENADLKKKISSNQTEINSCQIELKAKAIALSGVRDYSDYKFKYSWDGRLMKFPSPTSRKLSIRAIQFGIKETPTSMTSFIREESIEEAYILMGTNRYNLERSDKIFKHTGSPINIDNSTILLVIVRGKSGDTYFTNPVKSEWVVWDDTADKQVRID